MFVSIVSSTYVLTVNTLIQVTFDVAVTLQSGEETVTGIGRIAPVAGTSADVSLSVTMHPVTPV